MHNYLSLIEKLINSTISKKERLVLEEWVMKDEKNKITFKNQIKKSKQQLSIDFDAEAGYENFLKRIKQQKESPKLYQILRYAAVLALLISLGVVTKKSFFNQTQTLVETKILQKSDNDIVITLSDGSIKKLGNTDDSNITDNQGNIIANREVNSLVFDQNNSKTNTLEYNEIYIPYGKTFKLKLSDNTVVWLNAGSKLKFPQSFIKTEKERVVFLEGEAFFEVTKNETQPFIVNTEKLDIKVLGTAFNVSSYQKDNFTTTTLVEGSVSVSQKNTLKNILLTPSYQASYSKKHESLNKTKVDTSIYTAWMQNKLVINDLSFSEILQKLERKHQVTFVNKLGNLNGKTFKGEFKDESIEAILNTMALSASFKYTINNNTITIYK